MSEPGPRPLDPVPQGAAASRLPAHHAALLADRLKRFSYGLVAVTLALAAILFLAGLTEIALRLMMIWVGGFCLLAGAYALTRRSAVFGRSPLVALRAALTVVLLAVSGVAGVAGAFILAGVPVAGALVLASATLSTALIVFVGAI